MSGAEMGADNIVAASGPSTPPRTGFAPQASTSCANAVLNGSASLVAIRLPQRNAAANSHGVSRSRRSRYHRIRSGTRKSAPERTSALRNTISMSARMPARRLSWTSAA